MKFVFLIFMACLFVGCSSLSEEQCRSGNWELIGTQDGQSGKTLKQLSRHHEACMEYGISVNTSDYNRGYNEGLKSFCTLESGFEKGRSGEQNNRVCKGKAAKDFDRGHAQGFKLYTLEKRIAEVEKQIDTINNEIEKTYNDESLTNKSFSARRGKLTRKRTRLEKKLRRFERELSLLQTTSLIKSLIKFN